MKKRSPDFPKLTRNILTPLITSVDERETNMGTSFFASVSFLVLSKCLQHACIVQTKRLSITFVGTLTCILPTCTFLFSTGSLCLCLFTRSFIGFLSSRNCIYLWVYPSINLCPILILAGDLVVGDVWSFILFSLR